MTPQTGDVFANNNIIISVQKSSLTVDNIQNIKKNTEAALVSIGVIKYNCLFLSFLFVR